MKNEYFDKKKNVINAYSEICAICGYLLFLQLRPLSCVLSAAEGVCVFRGSGFTYCSTRI